MVKTVLFPVGWWTRPWARYGLATLFGVTVAVANVRPCHALGAPTDLQAIDPSPDDVSAAARYFDEGRAAFKQERYIEAAEAFEKADALAPNAKVLLLAIQSRELGGHLSRAATLAALATQRHPKDEMFADVGQLLKSARSEFNFVTISCNDPCQVMVGNRLLHGAAATRRFLFLEQGKYRIRATWSDGKSLSKYYEAEVGQKGNLEFDSSGEQATSRDVTASTGVSERSDTAGEASSRPTSRRDEPDEDYWADGDSEAVDDPPDDPFEASARVADSDDATGEQGSSGWSPTVFWIGVGTTVALAGASTWSGIHTLNNPGRETVVRECVGLGVSCPRYQEGLRNQDRTNILWTVTAGAGVVTGLIGLLLTDWSDDASTANKGSALGGAARERRVSVHVQPLLDVNALTRGATAFTGSYVSATGRF